MEVVTYYALIEGLRIGPLTMEELEEMSQEGFIAENTPVRSVDYRHDHWPIWGDIRPYLMPLPPQKVARPFSEWKRPK